MRLRIAVLACALSALVAALGPSAASAAPHHNRGLTLRAVPRNIIAGEAVLIYGRLTGPNAGGQTVRLYHRINPRPDFSLIGSAWPLAAPHRSSAATSSCSTRSST